KRGHGNDDDESLHGAPAIGVLRYGNWRPNRDALIPAPSTYARHPVLVACRQPPDGASVRLTRAPIATRSSMSTTSSPGRRPFGKPAGSQSRFDVLRVAFMVAVGSSKHPDAPNGFCAVHGVAGIAVLRR